MAKGKGKMLFGPMQTQEEKLGGGPVAPLPPASPKDPLGIAKR